MRLLNRLISKPYKNIHELEDEKLTEQMEVGLIDWKVPSRIEQEREDTAIKLRELTEAEKSLETLIEEKTKELQELRKIIAGTEAHAKAIEGEHNDQAA